MNTVVKQKEMLRAGIFKTGVALLLSFWFLSGLSVAEAAPPYQIMYSTQADRSSPQPLQGATITDDIWVFVNDPAPHAITEVWWKKGAWARAVASRNTTYDSFDWDDTSAKIDFGRKGLINGGSNTYSATPVGSGEPTMVSTFLVPYGATYLGLLTGNFKINAVIDADSTTYIVAGNQGLGSGMDWRIEKRDPTNGSTNWSQVHSIGAAQDELYDIAEAKIADELVAVGSYHNGVSVRPAVRSVSWGTGSTIWTNNDVWQGSDGAVQAVVVGIENQNDPGPNRSDVEESAWVTGYKQVGSEPHWAISKLAVNSGGASYWLQDTDQAGDPIPGEARAITKDATYVYIGGYERDASGDKYWRLEKRNRSNGEIVQEFSLTGVRGEIFALALQTGAGSEALWVGGYEEVGGGHQWRLQKFELSSGSLTPGVAKTWNEGAVKSIQAKGTSHVYVAGVQDATDPRFLVEAYGINGVQKTGSEAVLLSENLSSAADVVMDMELPYVVGWNGQTGEGYAQGVKHADLTISCSDFYASTPPADRAERIFIGQPNRGGLFTGNGSNMANTEAKLDAIEPLLPQTPVLPPGKYDIAQLTTDTHHNYLIEHVEETQDHEQALTYFFGADPDTQFVKSAPTEDIPNNATWKDSRDTSGVTIPFEVTHTTVAHYMYDQSLPPGTWDYNGVINFSPADWKHGGSLEAVCTVLDRYPQCNDGLDNDGDGYCDTASGSCTDGSLPGDIGCSSPTDDDELDGGAPACSLSGDYIITVGDGAHIRSNQTAAAAELPAVAASIPPGNYKVTLEAFDNSHPLDTEQPEERWFIRFLDASDNPLLDLNGIPVTTSATEDMDTNVVVKQEVVDDLPSPLVLPSGAEKVQAVHAAYPNMNTANSIHPICVAFELVGLPNFTPPLAGEVSPSSFDFDRATGFYKSATISYSVRNDGGAIAFGPFDNSFDSDFNVGGSYAASFSVIKTILGDVSVGDSTPVQSVELSSPPSDYNVPPGDYQVTITADSDEDVEESDEDDNVRVIIGSSRNSLADYPHIPAPDPGIELNVNPRYVRLEETTTLQWDTHATFDMDCTIYGPEGVVHNFNPHDPSEGPTGSYTTAPITAKSEYLLECIERISTYDAAFRDTAIVETTGEIEET